MALTAVSRLVVVDGDSFLNALFASAGQDRRAMEHRPQDRGPRRRTIDWQLDDRGALEARLGNVFNDLRGEDRSAIRKKRLPSIRIFWAPCLRYAQLPRMPTYSPSTCGALIISMPSL